jgi:hypothetical protein
MSWFGEANMKKVIIDAGHFDHTNVTCPNIAYFWIV